MHIPDIIIAIDGYSSTGKSSFAKLIASEFSFLYLDSGAMYRSVTLYAMENGCIGTDGTVDVEKLTEDLPELDLHFSNTPQGCMTFIGNRCIEKEIRTLEVSGKVSPVSAIPQIRDYINMKLREFGSRKRVVMDGRDIGTTVFPDAELKIFMTADPAVRAERRAKEMKDRGENVSLSDVLKNIEERDYIDSHREISPLKKADDAIVLDNSGMTLADQMSWIRDVIREKFGNTAK